MHTIVLNLRTFFERQCIWYYKYRVSRFRTLEPVWYETLWFRFCSKCEWKLRCWL